LYSLKESTLKKLLDFHGPDLMALQTDLYDRYQQLEDEA